MSDWHQALADLSEVMDDEFGTENVTFIPMSNGAGPQSKRIADPERDQIDGVCVIWSERHESSDTFRNKAKGSKFPAFGSDVNKMNIYCSFDCRAIPVCEQGDIFVRMGHRYEVVAPRPDGSMRTRADLVKVS